jgi:tellurite resistance protein
MIDPGYLLEGVLRGALGVRPKRTRRALGYLTGQRGGGLMSNPNTLLTAAGVVWGIFDTLNQPPPPGATPSYSPGPASSPPAASAPPPVPQAPPSNVTVADVPTDALRLVRLALSAASADGAMSERERAAIVAQAARYGGADLVTAEMDRRTPLAQIVSGVTDPAQRATLYVLAFTVLRADEQVSGAERIYLAQLAHLLGLSPDDVQRLEAGAAQRIDSQTGD